MKKKYPRFFVLTNPDFLLKNYIARVSVTGGTLYYTFGCNNEKFRPYSNTDDEFDEELAEKNVRDEYWKEISVEEVALKL